MFYHTIYSKNVQKLKQNYSSLANKKQSFNTTKIKKKLNYLASCVM